ncbi:MAG: pantetheine-phosphate adenylyltransferase [Vulcanimicrobiota bacterium]
MNQNHKPRTAVYPGSFDPFTNGHRDILERALEVFDKVIVAVVRNPAKTPLFTPAERVDIINNSVLPEYSHRISVVSFDGLLVEFMKQQKSRIILKGLRALSDFEFEFQMALMNRKLNPEVETVFLMTSTEYTFLSSSRVREIAMLNGKVGCLVSPYTEKKLREKFGNGFTGGETVEKD